MTPATRRKLQVLTVRASAWLKSRPVAMGVAAFAVAIGVLALVERITEANYRLSVEWEDARLELEPAQVSSAASGQLGDVEEP